MTDTAIRRLGPEDLAGYHAMLALFGRAFDDIATYTGTVPDDAYIRDLLRTPTFVALVAQTAGETTGALAAYILPKFEQARAETYIYDLAVDDRFRRQGIASALIEALKPISATMGSHVIFVQADYGDEPAIALYSKHGIREDVMHFDIDVEPGV